MIKVTEKMLTTILERIRNGSYDKYPYSLDFFSDGVNIHNHEKDKLLIVSLYNFRNYDKKGNVTNVELKASIASKHHTNSITISKELYDDFLYCCKENWRLQTIAEDKKLLEDFELNEE